VRLYVAGKREEAAQVEELARSLERDGHFITLEWWNHLKDRQSSMAERDLIAVQMAEALVVLLASEGPYNGALVEVGAALGQGKKVYIVGAGNFDVVFFHHPLVRRGRPVPEVRSRLDGLTMLSAYTDYGHRD